MNDQAIKQCRPNHDRVALRFTRAGGLQIKVVCVKCFGKFSKVVSRIYGMGLPSDKNSTPAPSIIQRWIVRTPVLLTRKNYSALKDSSHTGENMGSIGMYSGTVANWLSWLIKQVHGAGTANFFWVLFVLIRW